MFATDAEIENYIAGLQGGLDEFRQLIGSGRIAGVRQERGREYLQRLDARHAEGLQLQALAAAERAAIAAEVSAREAAKQSRVAGRSATIAIAACIITAIVGIASVVVAFLHR